MNLLTRTTVGFALTLLISLTVSSESIAQTIRNFTSDPAKFASEMTGFLEETDRKAGEKVMEEFLPVWTGGNFSAAQQESIYKTCNSMLRKRMKAFPDFRNYLLALVSFSKSGQSAESFNSWQTSIDKLLLLPARYFSNYITTCNLLFRDNTLYESSAVRWYAAERSYRFEFDSIPKIVFGNTDLVCKSKGDSSMIRATGGTLYPTRERFAGSGGRVDWARAGLDPGTARAELSSYLIDVTGSDFAADSSLFYFPSYFKQPILGRYSDKVLANVTIENATYPRFESYNTSFEIPSLVPGVDYVGGFSIMGVKIIGSGSDQQNASIFIKRDGKPFFSASSRSIVIKKDRLTSDNATVTFLLGEDSIYHPSLTLKYMLDQKELTLISGQDGKSQSPYFDSFHKMDLYFDGLYWKTDQPLIDMKMISGEGQSKAVFESSNYFRKGKFDQMQGISEVHPLFILKSYCENHGTREIYTDILAKDMRLPVSEVKNMLLRFSDLGFLAYDSKEDKALVKDKVYYYLQANVGKADYDVIRFESIISGLPNASMNLLNNEFTLRGLAPIILSDSQNVVIYPKDQEVKLAKDRNFTFAGRMRAGRFDFYGKQFSFDYQKFKVDMENVDSLRLKVESDNPADVDEFGRRKLVWVQSVLENITGDLIIDNQINKSGLKEYPEFPIFNSKKDSYVYYDKPAIQNGVYVRDKFYFHLDPFTIDSLDNFSRAGLRFGGEMVTAGIFPDFRDSLKLQPDLSLGLLIITGQSGWPAYGGKGKFISEVTLNNTGLHGNGSVEYLASLSVSNEFLFLPDSMNSNVRKFTNAKTSLAGVEFPDVKGDSVYEHWEPYRDLMTVSTVRKNIFMYDDQAEITGSLRLRPAGMSGIGTMKLVGSELDSRNFVYRSVVFDADTSDFRLGSDDAAALAFATDNVRAHIDMQQRYGEFKANGGGTYVRFPLNQYISFIDQFKWYMDQKELEMSSGGTVAQVNPADTVVTNITLSGSEFVSLEPRQDSLRFKAPFARYSLRDYLIKAEKVALVQTADAFVIPDSGKVVVERYAKMRTLNNARIIANTTTKYHTIYNATVDITGRKSYSATGDYDYVDENSVKHHFHFDNVRVDTSYQTIASGELADANGFPLSDRFLFKGTVNLMATHRYLNFSGFAKPAFQCELMGKNWIRFQGDINPANVAIPVDGPVTDEGVKLAAAIAQTSDSTGIYAAFLRPKQKATDLEIISAAGVLYFDKPSGQFRITTQERLDKPTSPGNFLSLDDKKCQVYGEGRLDFGTQLGQMDLVTVGNVITNLNNDSTQLDVLATVDFPMEGDVLKIMANQLANNPTLQPTSDIGRSTFERGIGELAGKDRADKMLAELNLYGSFKKIPDELRHTLFISDLKLSWDDATRSYRSNGAIGVASMDKVSINKKMKGFVEIVHKRSGDALNIYLEPEDGTWYYFAYARGMLQTLSTVTEFNEAIEKIKPEKRVSKVKDKPDFEYMLTTDRAVRNFIKRMTPQPPEEGQ